MSGVNFWFLWSEITRYFNLTALCTLFNKKSAEPIDYNNLRVTINGQSLNRIRDDKLDKFISFIQNYFIYNILDVKSNNMLDSEIYKKCEAINENTRELVSLLKSRNKK